MNPIEVYKKLPQKNCGKCSVGTCMAFAVHYLRRQIKLSECCELDDAGRAYIENMHISKPPPEDWKAKRFDVLMKEIAGTDFAGIADSIGATVYGDSGSVSVMYMGKKITVSPSGIKDDIMMIAKLLVLLYLKKAGSMPLSGKWVNFRDLKGGGVKSSSFQQECETPIKKMFEEDKDRLLEKLSAICTENDTGDSSDHSFVILGLPRIPMKVLLWEPDDEFGADCKVLFDSTATDYLDIESLCYMGENLVTMLNS